MNDIFYRTLSSVDTSNCIKIRNHTKKLIKESKRLKTKSNISFTNKTLTNFHTDHLKETIHSNQLYQKIYLANKISKTSHFTHSVPLIENYSPTQSTRMQSSHNMYSIKHSYLNSNVLNNRENCIKLKWNKKKNTRTRNNINTLYYNPNTRTELLPQFISKIQEEGRQRYALSIRTECYEELKSKEKTKVDQVDLDIYNYTTSFSLLKMFLKVYKQYAKYLNTIINKEQDICEDLKEKKRKLTNDLVRLKKKKAKILQKFYDNYNTKFFLMCVRNHSNQIQNFPSEDIRELTSDQLLIQDINHLSDDNPRGNIYKRTTSKGKITSSFKRTQTRRHSTIKRRNTKIFNENPLKALANPRNLIVLNETKSKNEPILESIKDFYLHLNYLTNKISNSLIAYNNKRDELQQLWNKMEEDRIDYRGNMSNNKIIQIEITEDENILEKLKERNAVLVNKINTFPQTKQNLVTVKKKIAQIVNELKKQMNVELLIPEYKKNRQLYYLKIIEKMILHLFDLHNDHKEKHPIEYLKQKEKREKENKIRMTKMVLMQEKLNQIEKNNRVIEKTNKLIIKEYRKIDRIQLLYSENHINKKNNQKFNFISNINAVFNNEK